MNRGQPRSSNHTFDEEGNNLDTRIIDLWADIGSKQYWSDFMGRNDSVFVPFERRWPQPGFIGKYYFDSSRRVVVMGQNPGEPKKRWQLDDDELLFKQIRKHSEIRTSDSLDALFSIGREFMKGSRPGRRRWRPIGAVEDHLDLKLENIAYLNLIPLTLTHTRIVPAYREAFNLSTRKQLDALNPHKIVVFGKGAYEKFMELDGGHWDVRYIEQRKFKKDAPSVRKWLNVQLKSGQNLRP